MVAKVKQLKENLILFPTAIDVYQVQLIHYLETERYAEALSLLDYLQKFTVDEQTSKEWHVLMTWLRGTVDEQPQQADGEEWTEEMLFRQSVLQKLEQEEQYTEKLLDTLTQTNRLENQLLSLEKLTAIDHPLINPTVRKWLESKQIHPLVQFKALQVLKSRGQTGAIQLIKNGHPQAYFIEQTPLQFNQFPTAVRRVLNRVIEISEISYASIGFFADEIWMGFISCIYGTPLYEQIIRENEQNINKWACVLHQLALESLQIEVDYPSMEEWYGFQPLTDEYWRKTYILLKNHAK